MSQCRGFKIYFDDFAKADTDFRPILQPTLSAWLPCSDASGVPKSRGFDVGFYFNLSTWHEISDA